MKQSPSSSIAKAIKAARADKADSVRKRFIDLVLTRSGFLVLAEFQFHPTRKWKLDYAIPLLKIAVEVEGGIWSSGRHINPAGFLKDMEKYNELAALNWLLIRTTPSKLFSPKNLTLLLKCIETRNKHPKQNTL